VFLNHQLDDWVQSLRLAEFASDNGTLESTKCTPYFAVQGTHPRMSFAGEQTMEWNYPWLDANWVQATTQQIHEHLLVEMRRSQAVQEEAANQGQTPAPNTQQCTRVWLDAQNIQTTRPTPKLDWKRLGPCKVLRRVLPFAYESELPASIQIHSVQPVSLLDTVVDDPLVGQWIEHPPQAEVDGEEEYQVSSVEDSRVYRKQLQ